ncbi:MAG: geopeptide radical SAM maturase [Deltaproteobacteria bacterium]|nr:geopeptide radical SAM maturase [Deltaproteobacteria bacterium]
MELSAYCKAYPFPERPGHCLVFSTRKGSLALLSSDAFARLERREIPEESARESLVKLGVLTADREAERREVLGYLEEVNRVDPCVTVAVILGMGCNFACPYCYEGSLKDGSAMTEATAEALARFVEARLVPGKQKLLLDFYGGEPLLYVDRIRQIASELGPVARERRAAFSFSLVTNGSLLTRDVVEALLPLGLRAAKVTIDGPADHHDRTRPFRSGKGSFEAVLANLRACCDLLAVGVGGNFLPESWRAFPRLLDRLEASGLGPSKLAQIRFQPVLRTNDRFSHSEFRAGCSTGDEPWAAEAAVSLAEEVLRRGYRLPPIRPTPCMADLAAAFTVHWDGTLYKCPAFVGHPEFAAGDVWSGPREHGEAYGGPRWRDRAECGACEYLPLCFGGCRYLRYQQQGSAAGVDCRRGAWEATLEPFLRLHALHRLG